jgi:hypothetical protein
MRLRNLRQKSLVLRGLILAGALLATGLIALPLGYAISQERVVFLAGAAAGIACLLAGLAGLGLREILHRPEHALAFLGLGMLFRMGIPLGAALAVYLFGGPLSAAAFLYYLVVFYPVMLAIETVLTLPDGSSSASESAPKQLPPR